jgi:outer membrane receptor protein involved in Fe transport
VQNVDAIRTTGLELAYQAANDLREKGLELGSSLTWTDSKITRKTTSSRPALANGSHASPSGAPPPW